MASIDQKSHGRTFAAGVPTDALLFCFFLAIYALVIYGQVRYGDEAERYLQAQSLVEKWSLVIPVVPAGGITGVGGFGYSQFEMGYGLVLVPLYALGRVISLVVPLNDRDWIPTLFVSLSNPIITALTCAVLYRFSRALNVGRTSAILSTAIFGLGTIALPYSKGLYREPLQGLTLLGALFGVFAFRRTCKVRWVWVAGFCFGYLALTKVANLSILPLLLAYLFVVIYQESKSGHARWISLSTAAAKTLAALLIPTLLLLAVQGIVNVYKFGNMFNIGPYNYGNPLPYFSLGNLAAGLQGLLFSPTKSLFVFAPPALLFVPASVAFFRKDKVDAVFLFVLVIYNLVFAASYIYWDGGTYWGPRYLVETVPLMILPLGFLLEMPRDWKGHLWRIVTAFIFGMGVTVQVVGALVNDREFVDVAQATINVTGGIAFLQHAVIDSFAFAVTRDGVQIQPYGWALLLVITWLGLWIVQRARVLTDENAHPSNRLGLGFSAAGMMAIFAAVVIFLAIPYPSALAAKGDTRFTAGESFRTEDQFCEAQAMYREALYFGTNAAGQSVARLEEIAPTAPGDAIDLNVTAAQVAYPGRANFGRDRQVFLTSDNSLKISVPAQKEAEVEADSEFTDVDPNTAYEISGWVKAEGVAGAGYAVIGWYEDNGKWRQARNLDLRQVSGTQGWQQFRQIVTTLATTRRVLLKAGMWKSSGTIWVDGIRMAELDTAEPAKALCAGPVSQAAK